MSDAEPPPPNPTSDEFRAPTAEAWRQAVAASLKGQAADSLTTETYEGITLKPIYTVADTADLPFVATLPGAEPFVRGTSAAGYLQRPWLVAQATSLPTHVLANTALRADLAFGGQVANLILDGPSRAGLDPDQVPVPAIGDGLSLASGADLTALLAGIDLTTTPIQLNAGSAALPLLALLVAHAEESGIGARALHGGLGVDPLGELAATGSLPRSLGFQLDELAQVALWLREHAPRFHALVASGVVYHNAGANAAQELAFALASGTTYLRELVARGVDVNTAASQISLDLAIGPQFFMEIAKFRAARLLWSQIVAAFGGTTAVQRPWLHARTGHTNKALLDPANNMLRVTTEALSAVLGGADSIQIAPFDEAAGPGSDFGRRIARNVHHILREETHLTRVLDPAGGTWAVESLTNDLAGTAWVAFQGIERQGGMLAALTSGTVQEQIAAVQAKRVEDIATRSCILIGVNEYAADDESALPLPAAPDRATLHDQRAAELAAYRAGRGHAPQRDRALTRLSAVAAAAGPQLVEAAIDAARQGATLGELASALRVPDNTPPAVAPLPAYRAAEPFEATQTEAKAAL